MRHYTNSQQPWPSIQRDRARDFDAQLHPDNACREMPISKYTLAHTANHAASLFWKSLEPSMAQDAIKHAQTQLSSRIPEGVHLCDNPATQKSKRKRTRAHTYTYTETAHTETTNKQTYEQVHNQPQHLTNHTRIHTRTHRHASKHTHTQTPAQTHSTADGTIGNLECHDITLSFLPCMARPTRSSSAPTESRSLAHRTHCL